MKNVYSDEENVSPFVNESINNDPTFEIILKSNDEIPDVGRIQLPIQRTVATHKYCCLCLSTTNLTTIPEEARAQSYVKKKIYIPQGNLCCRAHIIKNRIFDEDLGLLKVHSITSSITALELSKVMETLSVKCDSSLFDKVGEYSLSGKQLQVFTGLNWEQLNSLKEMLISLRNSQSRSVTQEPAVFLIKLRTGIFNKMLSSILQLENEHDVADYSSSVMKSFENEVLPHRFGLGSLNRDNLIPDHTTDMA